MSSDSAEVLGTENVDRTAQQHTLAAGISTAVLELVLLGTTVGYLRGVDRHALPADFEVKFSLIAFGLVLCTFYIIMLYVRYGKFIGSTVFLSRPARRRDFYKALSPERFMTAGSIITTAFVVAVLYGFPLLGEGVTLLIGLAFVTPLGVLLNEWGGLGEHFSPIGRTEIAA